MTHRKGNDYTPEACDLVIALMGMGLSLTAAAGATGISRATIGRWTASNEEFADAVSRGKAARVLYLERRMLASDNSAVISACRFALMNAAPDEWHEKPVVDPYETESPIRLLAEQISGRAIRPRIPEPEAIAQEPVPPPPIGSQHSPSKGLDDDEDKHRPRIHTVSSQSYDEED